MWRVYTAPRRRFIPTVPGPAVLVIQDATHGHTADNLALTQHNVLVIQDATHGHTADNVALVINLIVQDALHSHTADNLTLTQHNVLAIQDALHGHTADNLALTQHNVLAIADALHSHAADNLSLTQHNVLAVQDALHGHTADNLTLTPHDTTVLAIADARHTHTADNIVLAQHNILVIQDAHHAHRATDHWDSVHLDGSGTLTFSNTAISVYANGSGDFWDTSDGGSMVYHPLPGPQVEQGITTFTSGSAVRFYMLRKSTATNSAFYSLLTDLNRSHITTVWRDTDGASASWAGEDSGIAYNGTDSVRARMVYEGGTASAYVSLAGGSWQLVGSRSIAGLTLVALVDSMGSSGTGSTFTRDEVILTQHNVLAVQDARHTHTADNIVFPGAPAAPSSNTRLVRFGRHGRKRRQITDS